MQVVLQEGEWILPTRNGIVPSKPPLFHWIASIIAELTNLSPLASARMVSSASSALMIFIFLQLAAVVAQRKGLSQLPIRTVIYLAYVSLVTNYGFFCMAGKAMVDALFSLFCFAAVSVVLFGIIRGERKIRWNLFWSLCGFASLAKGPLGAALPILLAIIALSWNWGVRLGIREVLVPRIGWLIFLCIVIPWYIAAALKGEGAFLERQILFENVARLFGGENINRQPWWFYLAGIWTETIPWFALGTLLWIGRFRTGKPRQDSEQFLLLFVAGLALFSCASGKRMSYLLPLYPLLSMYVVIEGLRVWGCLSDLARSRFLNAAKTTTFLFGFVAISVFLLVMLSVRTPVFASQQLLLVPAYLIKNWGVLCSGAIALLAFAAISYSSNRSRLICLSIACTLVGPMLLGLQIGIKGEIKGFARFADEVRQNVAKYSIDQERQLYVIRPSYDEYMDPILYYIGRRVRRLDGEETPKANSIVFGLLDDIKKFSNCSELTVLGNSNPMQNFGQLVAVAKCT